MTVGFLASWRKGVQGLLPVRTGVNPSLFEWKTRLPQFIINRRKEKKNKRLSFARKFPVESLRCIISEGIDSRFSRCVSMTGLFKSAVQRRFKKSKNWKFFKRTDERNFWLEICSFLKSYPKDAGDDTMGSETKKKKNWFSMVFKTVWLKFNKKAGLPREKWERNCRSPC